MRTLAVIIISWNVKDLLDQCLNSLKEDLERTEALSQVWVVDNASTDSSEEMVQANHPWVNLETPGENLGFVKGNNLILKRFLESKTMPDFVWLLNPDTELHRGTTQTLLDFFDTQPAAGLAGPKLRNPDGSLQQSAFRFPGLIQPLFDFGLLPARFYETGANGRYALQKYRGTAPFRVGHPLGAAMMARGAAVSKVGPLDEDYFMYCEEIDWAWRMRKAGWQAWLVPKAEIVHYGGASTGQNKPGTTAYLWESRALFYKKHRGALTRALVGALVRKHFKSQTAPTPGWEAAYQRILDAWSP